MFSSRKYDYPIIVIGAGAGGLVVAIGGAKAGKKVRDFFVSQRAEFAVNRLRFTRTSPKRGGKRPRKQPK